MNVLNLIISSFWRSILRMRSSTKRSNVSWDIWNDTSVPFTASWMRCSVSSKVAALSSCQVFSWPCSSFRAASSSSIALIISSAASILAFTELASRSCSSLKRSVSCWVIKAPHSSADSRNMRTLVRSNSSAFCFASHWARMISPVSLTTVSLSSSHSRASLSCSVIT